MTSRKTEALHALARETMTSKDELKNRIEELEAENKRLRGEKQPSTTRRRLIRGAAVAGAGAVSLAAAAGTAAAAPSGTYPVPSDDPLLKTRVDRVRFIPRSGEPETPSGGRVVVYIDEDDLP